MNTVAWILFLTLSASAHEGYPIYPVHATLRVEPDRIVADLRADSTFWIATVASTYPMPTQNWPEDIRARVESYVNSHFHLSANGSLLSGKLVEAHYRQQLWEVNEEGVFLLRMVYAAIPAGGALTGTSSFYEEYRREITAEYQGRKIPYASDYRAFVNIPGRRRLAFTLTPEAPSFTASTDEARRTTLAMTLESFLRAVQAVLGEAAGFPALLAIALCLGAKPPSRTSLLIFAAAVSGGFVLGHSFNAPTWVIWAATLGASLAVGRHQGSGFMSCAAVAALGLAWSNAVGGRLPHCALAFPAALGGALAAGAALLSIVWLGVRAEYRRLGEVSESRVDELFARRARMTATALAMVGAYGLWQSLQR